MARLIIDAANRGIWNMSVDEALLTSAANDSFPTTLRFYQWDQATLSLGYFQRHDERAHHESSLGCSMVRRATGGGAIVHHHELTYSFITGVKNRLSRDVEGFYHLFHQTLIDALAKHGIGCQLCPPSNQPPTGKEPFLCFERRAAQDVVLGSAKVAGSAQRRHKGCLLQHGSVLLGTTPYAPELPGIWSISGSRILAEELAGDWTSAIEASLGTQFQSEPLTDEETGWAKSFARSKFGDENWTKRR